MKSDPHLIETETALIDGHTYFAKCGKGIVKAQAVMMWDSLQVGTLIPTKDLQIRCCNKCWRKLQDEGMDPLLRERYLYGIVAGKEQETEE